MAGVALVQEVVFDCAEPARLAQFWGELMDAPWGAVDEGWAVVRAQPVLLAFQRVPEPKQSPKNRLHIDVQVDELPTWVARAQSLGAVRCAPPVTDEQQSSFVVLRDIEDNEFCFVTDPGGTWLATQLAALNSSGPATAE